MGNYISANQSGSWSSLPLMLFPMKTKILMGKISKTERELLRTKELGKEDMRKERNKQFGEEREKQAILESKEVRYVWEEM